MRTATPTFSEAFGAALCDLAGKDDRVVAVCAAMPEGTGLQSFASKFPDRFFDVGIAEPHAVTFAAGLAAQGYRPVVAIYSTFLQRAVDGIIHDIALQRLPVTFAIDRAGLVGADGPTHHGMFDLSLLGMIPGVNVSAPACLDDLPSLLETAVSSGIPWAVRFPRGTAPSSAAPQQNGVRWLRRPAKPRMAVIALGPTAHAADSAIRAMGTGGDQVALVASLHAKPIPAEILDLLSANPHLPWISIEAGCLTGGFGQRLLTAAGRPGMIIGYPETFPGIGSPAELEEAVGLSPSALQKKIESALAT